MGAVKECVGASTSAGDLHVSVSRMGTPARVKINGGDGRDGAMDSDAAKGECAWQRAHHCLTRLARQHAALDAEEGRWLLAAFRAATHVHLGFASFAEYVERLFGYSRRSTQEKLRVAEALLQLPALSRALEEGVLSGSAVRELTRVATAETESEWLDFARGKSVRQLEPVIAGARPGDTPESVPPPGPRHHILRFEVAPETFALFREATRRLRAETDARLDDDAVLLSMARCVLGGSTDQGRSSYQVSLSVCPACGRGAQHASGELVAIGAEVIAMADCDGQHLGVVDAPANDRVEEAVAGRCGGDGDAHVSAGFNTDGDANAHVDAHPKAHAHANARAKQTIPPKLRRAVLLRDQCHCRVPGCRNSRFLDVHHIQPRSTGGRNEAGNLITLCGAHHRAIHRGDLSLEWTDTRLRFRHADGHPYGDVARPPIGASPPPISLTSGSGEVYVKVHSALRHLGFREVDVRPVLDDLRQIATQVSPAIDTTAERLLREALVRLDIRRRGQCEAHGGRR
jgi:hypothetical protein